MTPLQAQEKFKALRDSIGTQASLSVTMSMYSWDDDSKNALTASLSPFGWTSNERIKVGANNFEDLYEMLEDSWQRRRAELNVARIKEIAMKIIELTDAHGECTDSMLRVASVTDDEIKNFGEHACLKAQEMADKGPFSISRQSKGNGDGSEENEFKHEEEIPF